MRFDSSLFWHHWDRIPWQQQIEENRIYVRALEQLGFKAAWVCEHHFFHDGNFACTPNPILTNADLASHTTTLRLGQSPVSVPVWHPLRVAEDIALLDHMTGGRVEFDAPRTDHGQLHRTRAYQGPVAQLLRARAEDVRGCFSLTDAASSA